ncbi:MAG: MFS transporter [Streptosporangiaceae bacterium]
MRRSTTAGAFLGARALMELAGAGVIVMAVSALAVLSSEEERPRAVGIWAAASFVALPIGPILGGWLLTTSGGAGVPDQRAGRRDRVPLENRIRQLTCRSSERQAASTYSLIRPSGPGL